MKKSLKLIPAIVMLLVSAILVSTTTFAWFSMNTFVEATGMQVTAKSDNSYLLIGTGTDDTAAEIQAISPVSTSVALTVAAGDADVYPSAPVISDGEVGYLTVAAGHYTTADALITTAGAKVTSLSTADAVTNWYTATAAASDAPTMLAGSAKQLTSFTDYVITKSVWLTVAVGANDVNNLTVTPTITQKVGGTDVAAVKVMIATDDGGFTILSSANNGNKVDIKGSNNAITAATVRRVNIYIYYDGNAAPVYTNNAANLSGADIQLRFDVEPVPAS